MAKNFKDVGAIEQNVIRAVFDGEDQFSLPIVIRGAFNLSVMFLTAENEVALPAFVGSVTLQRAFLDVSNDPLTEVFIPAGEDLIWGDVIDHSTAFEGISSQPSVTIYRAGIKTGNYTAGKAAVRIGG